MLGVTKDDLLRNEFIRNSLGVALRPKSCLVEILRNDIYEFGLFGLLALGP